MRGNLLTMPSSRVLVVDDDRKYADSLAVILNQTGFAANAVYSGSEAIRTALRFPPDFIVMEVMMDEDEVDGVDAAIAICELLSHCRIVLISAELEAFKRLAKASVRRHRFELLMKPVQISLLLDKLRPESVPRTMAA